MANLLDYIGLGHFLDQIKTLFVTDVDTNGDKLTYTKNGTTNEITIPYATKAGKLSVTSTDNAVVRFDGTSGNVQNSGVIINDSNHVTATKFITSGGTSSQFVKGDGSVDSTIYGTYSKPSGGIPSTDLASAVLTSLGKADIALPNTTKYASSQAIGGAADKAVSIPFGLVDSTSTATAFTAIIEGITELRNGVVVRLRNGVITSAANCTLNVNNLGALPIYFSHLNQRISTHFTYGSTMLFIYSNDRVEGGCWEMYAGYDSNNNDTAYRIRLDAVGILAYNNIPSVMLVLSNGKYGVAVNETGDTTTTKVLTTESFDPFGNFFYYSGVMISAGSSVGNGMLWLAFNFDLRRTFNITATEFVTGEPIYLVAIPQSDGLAKLHSSPLTQTLPNTEDGLIYIFLGMASSGSSLAMHYHHPIYYFKNGAIRIWTGIEESHDYKFDYLTTVNVDSVAGTFNVYVGAEEPLSYSIDNGKTWVAMADGTLGRKSTPSIEPGGKVLWKNTNPTSVHVMAMNSPKIDSTIDFNAEGNLLSFVLGDSYNLETYTIGSSGYNFGFFFGNKLKYANNLIFPTLVTDSSSYTSVGVFSSMFAGCVALIEGPTKLSNLVSSYQCLNMFNGCSSLITAPELPDTNLTEHCYSDMFYGCSSLIKTPELPATTATISCYLGMFQNCTSLKEVSNINLEGTAAFSCMYQMFKGCTNLLKGPEVLKLTNLGGLTVPGGSTLVGCYEEMFTNCTSLIKAPDIMATTISTLDFKDMFNGCSSLKELPYIAPITGTGKRQSHYQMFKGCSSLKEVTIASIGGGPNITYQCTGMFENCTSLTKATIKVSASGTGNFNNMFKGCTNLNFIEGFSGTPSATTTADWVNGVAATGTFIKKDTATWDVTGVNGVPSGWNVYTESEYELVRLYQLNTKENTSNKVTSISSSSTDTQYPSAKCVYDLLEDNCDFIEGLDIYADISIVNNNYYFIENNLEFNDF